MSLYRCGPTAVGSRTSWGPVSSPTSVDPKSFERPISGNFDRIFNAFERTNAFEYVRSTFEAGREVEERLVGHADVLVNRKMSSSFQRAEGALAAQTPSSEDEDYYRDKVLYSQARQLFPLQEDLADWINKTIGITYLNGDNFLDALDNGVELCQLAAVIHERAADAHAQGLVQGPVPQIRGRCWQRAARRSFFSRDNTENFITFCRELGVHQNLLFESDDLVLHNQPRQVVLCLLETGRLASRYGVEPPGLVQLEREIALEERDSGLDSAMSVGSAAPWDCRARSRTPDPHRSTNKNLPPSPLSNGEERACAECGCVSGCVCVCVPDSVEAESTRSGGSDTSDSDVPLRPADELDKHVQLVTRLMERGCRCESGKCSKLLKVKKVGEGRYNIAGRNYFIRLLKGRHMMVRVGGGWDTLEHFLSRHEPCQVRLVTPAARARPALLLPPAPAAHPAHPAPSSPRLSPASSKASLSKDSVAGTVSPVDSKASSVSGKTSPVHPKNGRLTRASSKGSSDTDSSVHLVRRTSTPIKSVSARNQRSSLTLPLKLDSPDDKQVPKTPTPRPRKQSAPSFSTPNTPTGRTVRTKSLTSTGVLNTPKKSRSMSLAIGKGDDKPVFCGTERLNKAKPTARGGRSQSLASTPVSDKPAAAAADRPAHTKKSRSMSLASSPAPLTQAAIEESIRLSLAATIADDTSSKKPFLHIKGKYRSPPPREIPPR